MRYDGNADKPHSLACLTLSALKNAILSWQLQLYSLASLTLIIFILSWQLWLYSLSSLTLTLIIFILPWQLQLYSQASPTLVSNKSFFTRVGWVLLYVHRNRRLIRDGSPGQPPRLSHSSWTLFTSVKQIILYWCQTHNPLPVSNK